MCLAVAGSRRTRGARTSPHRSATCRTSSAVASRSPASPRTPSSRGSASCIWCPLGARPRPGACNGTRWAATRHLQGADGRGHASCARLCPPPHRSAYDTTWSGDELKAYAQAVNVQATYRADGGGTGTAGGTPGWGYVLVRHSDDEPWLIASAGEG